MIARLNGNLIDSTRVEYVSDINLSVYEIWVKLKLRKRAEAIEVYFTDTVKTQIFNLLVDKKDARADEKRFVHDFQNINNVPMPSILILTEHEVFYKIRAAIDDFLKTGVQIIGGKNEIILK